MTELTPETILKTSNPGDRTLRYKTLLVLMLALTVHAGDALSKARPRESAEPRRDYPSIFQAWSGIENLPQDGELSRLARHDLVFTGSGLFGVTWEVSPEQPYSALSTTLRSYKGDEPFSWGRRRRKELLKRNPHMRILCELRYREARYVKDPPPEYWKRGDLPPDSEFWLREDGELAPGWGEDDDGDGKVERDEIRFMLVDFTKEAFQNLLAEKARALEHSGLFDGIMLDWWKEGQATSGRWPNWDGTIMTAEEETEARLSILRKIRKKVSDDFLILVNSNYSKVPRSAPHVNGLFMECYRSEYDTGYTDDQMSRIEDTLLWAERNLRRPRINCLEGWRIVEDYTGNRRVRVRERNSSENRKWMRLFTTLSLTHSDGYVLFSDHNALPAPDHLHNWYDFWDADLGRPVGEKARTCDGVDGLFLREFEKGWAACNRSGSARKISFGKDVTAFTTGKTASSHTVPNYDGQIFLKK